MDLNSCGWVTSFLLYITKSFLLYIAKTTTVGALGTCGTPKQEFVTF